MIADEPPGAHPDVSALAAYLDGALAPADRVRLEAHVATCAECRGEVVAAAQIIRTAPARRRLVVSAGLVAAAVLVLLLTPSVRLPGPPGPNVREPAVTTTAAPTAVAPAGAVEAVRALVWSAVPRAGRYRVMLLDDAGTLLWRADTPDTTLAMPDSVRLHPGASYFWKVEAETDAGRWVASELVDFTIRTAPR